MSVRWLTAATVCALGSVLVASSAATGESGQGPATDQILVKFAPGASAEARSAALGSVRGRQLSTIPGIGVQVVSVPSAAGALAQLKALPSVRFAEPDATAEAAEVPNDPNFSLEWGLSKIKAPDAWSTSHGSASVEVAVLDTGIASHPDLAGKVVAAKNFSTSSTLDDVYGHGTHVAGIAAAATNNATGVAGLGWSASLLNVKVLGDSGSGSYSAIANGITWAADRGADVINMSLGGTSASSTLQSAVDYAWSKGAVVVAAAGNNSSSAPFYPAYYANTIAVAATDNVDHLANFSDYGDWVDVAAPGVSIYSTIPGASYGYKTGTSMASPHVAGLAALLEATLTDTDGDGKLNDEVRSRIESTADNVGLTIAGGRINAYAAVAGSAPTTGAIAGTVTNSSSGAPLAGATVSDGTRSATSDTNGAYSIANVPAGTYTVAASASGYIGTSQSASVVASRTTAAPFSLSRQYMFVKSITFKVKSRSLTTSVQVVNWNGGPMVGATVTLTESWSGGQTRSNMTATTNSSGVATFVWQKAQPGTYTATVVAVYAGTNFYDSTKNVVTTASYTLSA